MEELDDEDSHIVEYLESQAEAHECHTLGNRELCRLLSKRVAMTWSSSWSIEWIEMREIKVRETNSSEGGLC